MNIEGPSESKDQRAIEGLLADATYGTKSGLESAGGKYVKEKPLKLRNMGMKLQSFEFEKSQETFKKSDIFGTVFEILENDYPYLGISFKKFRKKAKENPDAVNANVIPEIVHQILDSDKIKELEMMEGKLAYAEALVIIEQVVKETIDHKESN